MWTWTGKNMIFQADAPSPVYVHKNCLFRSSSRVLDSIVYKPETTQRGDLYKNVFKTMLTYNSMKVKIQDKKGVYRDKRIRFQGDNLVICSRFKSVQIRSDNICMCFNNNTSVVIYTLDCGAISLMMGNMTTAITMSTIFSGSIGDTVQF